MLLHHLTTIALAGAVLAQGTVTIPSGVVNRDGSSSLVAAGFVRPLRQQLLFGSSHLAGLAGRDLAAIRLRRDGFPVEQFAGRVDLTVMLSASPLLDVTAPSQTFAGNHRVPPTTVFQGSVALPYSPRLAHQHAATWTTPDAVTIPFAAPFRYATGALCVQLDGVPDASSPSTRWQIDAEHDRAGGIAIPIGRGCGPVAAQASQTAATEPSLLRVGSTSRFLGIGQPTSPAFFFLGAQALTPGVELTFLGAPGCFVYVVPVVSLAATVGVGIGNGRPGGATLEIPLPAQTGMLGATMYAQWAVLAGSALTTTNGLQLQLAASVSPLDGAVVVSKPATGATLPSSGYVDTATMAVVQFDHQ